MNRAEHDFYKILAHKLCVLRGMAHNAVILKELNEVVAIIDGYFAESHNKTRKEDILVSLLTDEQKREVCKRLNREFSDVSDVSGTA